MRRTTWLTASTIAIALLAGCGNSSNGTATPQTTTPTEPAPRTTTSTPKTTPTRPREIKLDGKNPCELITPQQRARFGFEREPHTGTSKTYKSPECTFNTNAASYTITTVTAEGVEAWRTGGRSAQVDEQQPIQGFPTLATTLPDHPVYKDSNCGIVVDVADGQYLLSTIQIIRSKASELPPKCEAARQFAEAAMATLTTTA
ncbi:hypothetical protein GCM10012275_54750 [Longimycelium tulufanense]|uniref:DUF3558 domain-containing protein n=1 Tax=Longimycelium tulufanense TaxID=907463 RepID=A0A8J3CHA1_9PSEU|nr:DUF3558 domain-containing protein [Longimycelium tulufanense]GGM77160.1 hypothetical protein GCM10012275_54750 [Longimycelium tulufanense]